METASLLNVGDASLLEEVFHAARSVKEAIYGNRIVLFAPLYITNECDNNCLYCGFRKDNDALKRRTMTVEEIRDDDGNRLVNLGVEAGIVGMYEGLRLYGKIQEKNGFENRFKKCAGVNTRPTHNTNRTGFRFWILC